MDTDSTGPARLSRRDTGNPELGCDLFRQRPIANMLKSMSGQAEAADAGGPKEANFFLDAVRGQAERLEKSDEELKARHAELARLLAEEQSRWTTFNARLEALELGRK